MDAGAKKDLTSFVEGMDRKEKKELLLGSRSFKLQTQLPLPFPFANPSKLDASNDEANDERQLH